MNDMLLRKIILVGTAIVSVAAGSYLAIRPTSYSDSRDTNSRGLAEDKSPPRAEYDWADSKRRLMKIARSLRLYQQEYGIGESESWDSMDDLRLPSGLETLTRFPEKMWALKTEDLRPSMTFHQFNSLYPTQYTIVHDICSDLGWFPNWKPEMAQIVAARKGDLPVVVDFNPWSVDEYFGSSEPRRILVIRQSGEVEETTFVGGDSMHYMDLLRNR